MDDRVEVTQPDRIRAAPFFRETWARDEALAGKRDDDSRIQAFARHRHAALESAAKVIEALEPIIMFGPPAGLSINSATRNHIAAAIRNLKGPSHEQG